VLICPLLQSPPLLHGADLSTPALSKPQIKRSQNELCQRRVGGSRQGRLE